MHNYLPELLMRIDEPGRSGCQFILEDNEKLFQLAPGSGSNHHAWIGGYWDHVSEVMNLATVLYGPMNERRLLPFSLSSALLGHQATDYCLKVGQGICKACLKF